MEMPGMDGIELARRIVKRYPLCNIIFLTGFSEYMETAFDMHVSGYLPKPFSEKKVRDALHHLRYQPFSVSQKPVRVQCFGSFEVYSFLTATLSSRRAHMTSLLRRTDILPSSWKGSGSTCNKDGG